MNSWTRRLVAALLGLAIVSQALAAAPAARPQTTGDLLGVCREFYRDRPFVRVLDEGRLPETKHVLHSNLCDIGVVADARTRRVIVVSAIDNLAKGASGQAVQCFNLMA